MASGLRVVNLNDQIQFDASQSEDDDGSIASYLWDFGDGNTATTKMAMHRYQSSGDYIVSLSVTPNLFLHRRLFPIALQLLVEDLRRQQQTPSSHNL